MRSFCGCCLHIERPRSTKRFSLWIIGRRAPDSQCTDAVPALAAGERYAARRAGWAMHVDARRTGSRGAAHRPRLLRPDASGEPGPYCRTAAKRIHPPRGTTVVHVHSEKCALCCGIHACMSCEPHDDLRLRSVTALGGCFLWRTLASASHLTLLCGACSCPPGVLQGRSQ